MGAGGSGLVAALQRIVKRFEGSLTSLFVINYPYSGAVQAIWEAFYPAKKLAG
jgi:hypothetical protein